VFAAEVIGAFTPWFDLMGLVYKPTPPDCEMGIFGRGDGETRWCVGAVSRTQVRLLLLAHSSPSTQLIARQQPPLIEETYNHLFAF
jgi:hypothetical protein